MTDAFTQFQKERRRRAGTVFAALVFLLLFFCVLCVTIGTVRVPLSEVLSILAGSSADPTASDIVLKLRLPRTLIACLLGGALSLSGYLLQTYFENPIAGPYVLGISSGAKLAVAFVLIVALGQFSAVSSVALVLAAFLGALLTTGILLLLARRLRSMASLLIAGIMIGYLCSAISELLITFAEDQDIVNLHGWSQGSFSGTDWGDVRVAAIIVLISAVLTFLLSKPIGALRLGEAYAKSVGVSIRRTRMRLILLSSLLSATVTAFAGPISFVGIAVPILIKRALTDTEPRVVIPACFLGGAVFCMGCDLLARTAFAPIELNISTVTAIFGAPVVIAAILSGRREHR